MSRRRFHRLAQEKHRLAHERRLIPSSPFAQHIIFYRRLFKEDRAATIIQSMCRMIHQKRYYESKVRQSDVASHKDTTVKQETLSSLNPDASKFISNNQLEEKLNVLEKTLIEDLKGIKRQLGKVVSQKTKYTSSRERLQSKKVQEIENFVGIL